MKVIFLGTGSGKPTLKRNVSALAIVREDEWMLFDCGEATQHQILRAGLRTSRLSAIFITHLHGDHFNGLPGLVSTMGLDGRDKPLIVVGPPGIREYLDVLTRLKTIFVNYPMDVREIERSRLKRTPSVIGRSVDSSPDESPIGSLPVHETERYCVTTAPLDHRIYDLGFRIEEKPRPGHFNVERALALGVECGPMFGRLQAGKRVHLSDGRSVDPSEVLGPPRPGKSIAYCTDTRPCAEGVNLARGADLLIHEATYGNELPDEADRYGHSTAAQAATIAKKADSSRLAITHFSSRYNSNDLLLAEARFIFEETIAGEDLLEIAV